MDNEEMEENDFFEDMDDGYQSRASVNFNENIPFVSEQKWMSVLDDDNFKILDPDDPLMERFQNALKTHLLRIDNRLSEEISELEAALKEANKTREDEGVALYEIQKETTRQETALDNYKDMMNEIINLRGDIEERLKKSKETHKKINEELHNNRKKEKDLLQTIESLDTLQQQFSKWESELAGNLEISQRISEKDAIVERELILQKQQKDYVLYKLEDEVWKLQNEIKDLDEQLQIKDQEKVALGQTIADVNVDIQGLEKEHKSLYGAWSSVLNLISQRDKINEEITTEQRKIRETLIHLENQVEKLKKDSAREMENNEHLTSLHTRVNEEIASIKKLYESDREKYLNLESTFLKISKLSEQTEKELNIVTTDYDAIMSKETLLLKEISKMENQKHKIENDILLKLDDQVCNDKAARHINKLLQEAKDFNLESELNLTRLENSYGKSLFEVEELNSIIENENFDLDALIQRNMEKQKENERIQSELRNYETVLKQKERKATVVNKKIEEILEATNREDVNPLDTKITLIEMNIDETEDKIKKSQQFWLRQQGYMYTLSEQRDLQMHEIGVVSKDIVLMEEKNFKLEIELEKQKKVEANMNRAMNALQQKLLQINVRLASQKELKNELEDKNNVTKNEYIKSLKDAEMELIKLESDLKRLYDVKDTLKEELKAAQQESLSWEKKVQLASETNKSYKEERSSGGDIAMMKSEIHKMEMRLSYLRKAQEKLVHDMEYCISRRENIMDEALTKEKRNPKNQHNQRIVFKKRLDDQKAKIKHIKKEIKQIESKIANAEAEQKKLLEYLNEGQKLLREHEDIIPDIEKQIIEAELIKHHNLEVLVRKQRKVNMLQDLKNGQYKIVIKNEVALNEELQKQEEINNYLKEIMQQTEHDFPLLKNQIRKILLTLQLS